MEFSSFCPHCKTYQDFSIPRFQERLCAQCEKNIFPNATDIFKSRFELNQCPHCGAAHVYRQKDFNRKLGITLLIIGIGLSFYTYGISLLLVTIIDWLLYKKVGEVGCCYLCESQFRTSPEVKKLEPFDLELYDYYQNIKK